MTIESSNPYTKTAIKTLELIRTDPSHESVYVQRAAAYAEVAQAIEIEGIGIVVASTGPILAEMLFELARIKKILVAMLPDDAPGIV